ncbi:hypothetical protein BD410DRAFT_310979 [Rickenella mellea]|uniref:DUF6533 domain-containing protein n=1 Tax=Rickenella mellea TaxID=50990 RepID=A0A4Y7Q0W0_9AGAM|nr:hypothetical protein BD410DRAFT_310979 [Rickenella mellea]
MFQDTAILPHTFLEPFIQLRIIKCTTIAAFSLVVWDYFVLLPDEIALVWPARWGLSKGLFIVNRYLAFVDPIMLIYVLLFADDAQVCADTFRALGYIATVGIMVAQWILILRTYAVWGSKNDKRFFGLFSIYLCTLGIDYWACHRYLSGVHSNGAPAPGMTGCTLFFENRLAWVSFVLIITVESTLISLLAYKAVQYFRIGGSSLMTVIYHDGLLYFACILATSITNLVVVLVAPAELHPFLIVVQRVLHSVLCSRILLHIRAVYVVKGEDSVRITDISPNRRGFYSDEVGSVGIRFNNSEFTTSTKTKLNVQ